MSFQAITKFQKSNYLRYFFLLYKGLEINNGMYCSSCTRIRIEDDILFLEYRARLTLNIKVAKKVVAERLIYQKNRRFPVFCDSSGIISADVEALDYFASEGTIFIEGLAIFSENPRAFLLSKFYVETHKQEIPTAVFENRFQALNFLNRYKRKNK